MIKYTGKCILGIKINPDELNCSVVHCSNTLMFLPETLFQLEIEFVNEPDDNNDKHVDGGGDEGLHHWQLVHHYINNRLLALRLLDHLSHREPDRALTSTHIQ